MGMNMKVKLFEKSHKEVDDIYGDNFAINTGYLNYAAANNLIILMPQIMQQAPMNDAISCWDFTGYTGHNYANNKGIQPKAIKAMVDRLMGSEEPDWRLEIMVIMISCLFILAVCIFIAYRKGQIQNKKDEDGKPVVAEET